jgi:hypothetical protein
LPIVLLSRELALALEHVNLHTGLVVRRGGKDFRFARRDGGVALDQFVKTPPKCLDTERKRVTSSKSTSLTSPFSTPPWMAAPTQRLHPG